MFCSAVYVSDVLDLFEGDASQGLILLVPVRLGSEALNPIYIPCVKVHLQQHIVHCDGVWLVTHTHSGYVVMLT